MSRARRRRRHSPECRHCPRVRLLGMDYQCWRAAHAADLEAVAVGYASETRAYLEAAPAPTFRAYLESMTGAGWPMSGQAPRRAAA